MSSDRAAFHAINAITLTGFDTIIPISSFRPAGIWCIAGLNLAGALLMLVGTGWAVSRIFNLRIPDRRILLFSLAFILLATLLGSLLLRVMGYGSGAAAFLSLSAVSNSGLTLAQAPSAHSSAMQGILLPLMWAGGVGITVLIEIFDRLQKKRRMSLHARVAIGASAGFYIMGCLGFVLMLIANNLDEKYVHRSQELPQVFAQGSAFAQDTRSAGFELPMQNLGRPVDWLAMVLMLVGGGTDGTAGGLRMTTICLLLWGTRKALQGRLSPLLGYALMWTAIYLLTLFVLLLTMLLFVPEAPADRLLFLVISAVGNVGLSHEPVALTGVGLWVLNIGMMAGRILPLAMLWWMVSRLHNRTQTAVAI